MGAGVEIHEGATTALRRELEARAKLRSAENTIVEQGAILGSVFDGKEVSDFGESFPLVRAAVDLRARLAEALHAIPDHVRARHRTWSSYVENAILMPRWLSPRHVAEAA
jgi:hypothetical protein